MFVGSRRLFKRIPISLSLSQRSASTLTFLEVGNDAKITPASLSTLTAANKLNQPINVVIFGKNGIQAIKEDLPKYGEFQKIYLSKEVEKLPEEITPILEKIININNNDISHFFVPSSFLGKSILPRLASKLDVQPLSDIISIEENNVFKRFIYAGNAIAKIKSNDKLILASIRSSSFEPIEAKNEVKEIEFEEIVNNQENKSIEYLGEETLKSERPDLGSAKIVVSGGKGLANKETFDSLMDPLATTLGAAIGASRAAVDAGFVDNSLQVGQTGKIIAPDLYIAVGISGAIQHLAGMKDSKTIVAINKADDALIFNVADYGLVGDLNEIVPELTERIKQAKNE